MFTHINDSIDTRFCKQLSILDAPAFSTLAFRSRIFQSRIFQSRIFPVLHFPPLHFGPAFSSPAFSTLAFWTVPHFPVSHFQPPHITHESKRQGDSCTHSLRLRREYSAVQRTCELCGTTKFDEGQGGGQKWGIYFGEHILAMANMTGIHSTVKQSTIRLAWKSLQHTASNDVQTSDFVIYACGSAAYSG